MKLIKVKITPNSSFVSFPKGDMIFGHFAYYTFLDKEQKLKNYLDEEPKIIFSDFLPDGYLYKPTLPIEYFGISQSDKKDFKNKKWIKIKDLQNGNLSESEELSFFKKEIRVRNSLNRVSFMTDESGEFTPFSIEEIKFLYQPVVFIRFDEKIFDEKYIIEILNKIGKNGFGKKGTIGKGQFEVEKDKEFNRFDNFDTNYYLTISPTLLHNQTNIIQNSFYNTFNRFGKYSNSNTPFKKPVLMADSGAVVELEMKKQYIGKAISNGEKSFLQGYSIVVPFKLDRNIL